MCAAKDDYLLFLGRMCPDKGVHHAIEVARAAGLPLRIAAKCREEDEFAYFEQRIAPLLGPDVEWIGEVAHDQKVELLSRARALVFPIDWEEPFGLVMIEALACGTPVLATRRGAVPEVIDHGTTGFVVDDVREMPAALARAVELDAAMIRAVAEARFTPERLVAGYLAAYETARGPGANGGSQVDIGRRRLRHVHRHAEHRDLADRPLRNAVVSMAVHDEIAAVGTDGSREPSLPEPRKTRMDSGSR